MLSQSLNIIGVVRDGGDALVKTLARIDDLCGRLDQSRIVIATNDNSDGTGKVLASFANRLPQAEILTLDGLSNEIPNRVERITFARNAVLERLFSVQPLYDATLILDLDGPNTHLSADSVLRALERGTPNWDGVFGNALPAYYDLYALRCAGWCEEDVWQRIHSSRKPLFHRRRWRQQLLKDVIFGRQYHIPIEAQMIPVQSAFAGLGLYRTKRLEGLKYDCRDGDGRLVCEHVMLHQLMLSRGARLYIDPGLTTVAPSEHLGEGSGAPLPAHLPIEMNGQD